MIEVTEADAKAIYDILEGDLTNMGPYNEGWCSPERSNSIAVVEALAERIEASLLEEKEKS